LLEGRPCAGETDANIVAAAWDFQKINSRYAEYMEVLEQRPKEALSNLDASSGLQKWAASERACWLEAVGHDPLLPKCLLPEEYLGRKAWDRRVNVLKEAGKQLTTFTAAKKADELFSHV